MFQKVPFYIKPVHVIVISFGLPIMPFYFLYIFFFMFEWHVLDNCCVWFVVVSSVNAQLLAQFGTEEESQDTVECG